jgi:hypothetical protein
MVDDDIDIFSPDLLYPSSMRERKETIIEKPVPKTLAEKRKIYQEEAKTRSIKRKINHLRITDDYVRSLERQVVDAKTYLAVKDLNTDFNEFTNKYKEKQNGKKGKEENNKG